MSEALDKIGVTYGAIVMLRTGVQAVVGKIVDDNRIPVVATGGNRIAEVVPLSDVTVLPRPRNVQGCAGCGDVWVVHGDRTSHCRVAGCHQTFEGGVLWDSHRIQDAAGNWICKRASSMEFRGERLRKVADTVEGLVTSATWRGPKLDVATFGGDAA